MSGGWPDPNEDEDQSSGATLDSSGRRRWRPAADGVLITRVAARLSLAEAVGAHRLLAARTAGRGRIVLL
jgi:hypothetical protein